MTADAGAVPAPSVTGVAGIESAGGAARTTSRAPAVQVLPLHGPCHVFYRF